MIVFAFLRMSIGTDEYILKHIARFIRFTSACLVFGLTETARSLMPKYSAPFQNAA